LVHYDWSLQMAPEQHEQGEALPLIPGGTSVGGRYCRSSGTTG